MKVEQKFEHSKLLKQINENEQNKEENQNQLSSFQTFDGIKQTSNAAADDDSDMNIEQSTKISKMMKTSMPTLTSLPIRYQPFTYSVRSMLPIPNQQPIETGLSQQQIESRFEQPLIDTKVQFSSAPRLISAAAVSSSSICPPADSVCNIVENIVDIFSNRETALISFSKAIATPRCYSPATHVCIPNKFLCPVTHPLICVKQIYAYIYNKNIHIFIFVDHEYLIFFQVDICCYLVCTCDIDIFLFFCSFFFQTKGSRLLCF
jgi:hypothetical protein